MDLWLLLTGCVAGMAFPAALIARHGRHRVTVASNASLFRSVVVSVESGLLAGILAGGLGARLFMRIAAAVSPDRVQGFQTSADETVGEITFGGTLFLVLFIGMFGGPAMGLVYRALRRFLPLPAYLAGIAVVALPAAALGGATNLTNPGNDDFTFLSPTPFIALLIGAYIVFAGAALGATHEWLERTLPAPSRRPRTVAAYAPALLGMITPAGIAAVVVGTVFVGFAEHHPQTRVVTQRAVGAICVLAGLVVLTSLVQVAT